VRVIGKLGSKCCQYSLEASIIGEIELEMLAGIVGSWEFQLAGSIGKLEFGMWQSG
jgi:hypothetical protein